MIERAITQELVESAAEFPVVTVSGPRQSGKTTLVQMTFPHLPYASLEDPDVRLAAEADPRGFLEKWNDGVILGEVQRLPGLLSYVQGMVDQERRPGRFVLTGSHQPRLQEAIGQTLAGRTALLTLWPFSFTEIREYGPALHPWDLIVQGFYPRIHEESLTPRRFFNSYLQTYVERDVRALVQLRDLSLFQKFLVLLAGRVGHLTNHASLANDVGVSATTVRNWLSVLLASHVVFELRPYSANIRKRLVKSPKIYFTDVGLAAFLLGIRTADQAARDPLRGGLYENLVIADIAKGALNRGRRPEMFFYRDSNGNEVDLLIRRKGRLVPIEIKSGRTFSTDYLRGLARFRALGLENVTAGVVLYDGSREFDIHGVRVVNPLSLGDPWEDMTVTADA